MNKISKKQILTYDSLEDCQLYTLKLARKFDLAYHFKLDEDSFSSNIKLDEFMIGDASDSCSDEIEVHYKSKTIK